MTRGAAFYDRAYRQAGDRDARWRELGAVGKADHVQRLLRTRPERLVEIGCGDGALLAELERRGAAGALTGFDVSDEAVRAARARGLTAVVAFDGQRLPVGADAFDVALLSHVLEHVDDPAALLREAARVAPTVVVEVPLEASVSGRRAAKRAHSGAIGHVQTLDRAAARALVAAAGLRIRDELMDPLPAAVNLFFADTRRACVAARAKAALRHGLFAASPPLAARLFTVHYACVCTRS
ncbi:MAG: class I SAM-dependent methyltransferase [Thermoleophilaceae bacterium]